MDKINLLPCPFCGGDNIKMIGDHTVYCSCGASVNEYNYNENTTDKVVSMWNHRSTNLEPLINRVSKMKGQGSAYTDLCSANYKLNQNRG
jgi:Lar family restriction alleviation protein